MSVRLLEGDSLTRMAELSSGSIGSVCTDPPYGLKFMGKAWDHGVPGEPYWREALRVLQPGGHLVAFGGTRTYHRLTCAIEDAGFEIRDCLMWLYGSGFPKGKGCLKPGWEPIVLARKKGASPLLNLDACRIDGKPRTTHSDGNRRGTFPHSDDAWGNGHEPLMAGHPTGRWPANVVLSHEDGCQEIGTKEVQTSWSQPTQRTTSESWLGSRTKSEDKAIGYTDANGRETVAAWECVPECAVRMLDEQSGIRKSGGTGRDGNGTKPGMRGNVTRRAVHVDRGPDSGGASRFFYCAKASPRERNAGMLEGQANQHPTVKPLSLMSWLVKLVTPPGGVVLDPFMGSGTTGCAAAQLGLDFIGIDLDPESIATARQRIAYWSSHASAGVSARPSYGRADRDRSSSLVGSLPLPFETLGRASHG